MKNRARTVAGMAIFTALAYVSALASVAIPNVSLIFIVVFFAGLLFGKGPGLMVGALGEFLWTSFNPYGMPAVPLILAQVIGMACVGLGGGFLSKKAFLRKHDRRGYFIFALMGLFTASVFQILVSITLALLYGPFWPSLFSNLYFALITVISSTLIFGFSYPIALKIYRREQPV